VTKWLHLAAAPAFTLMALVTAASDNSAPNMLCSAAAGSWLAGMTPMYALMAVFHSAPWLKLISAREGVTPFVKLDRSSSIQAMEQKP
jgi:hypothetical protein